MTTSLQWKFQVPLVFFNFCWVPGDSGPSSAALSHRVLSDWKSASKDSSWSRKTTRAEEQQQNLIPCFWSLNGFWVAGTKALHSSLNTGGLGLLQNLGGWGFFLNRSMLFLLDSVCKNYILLGWIVQPPKRKVNDKFRLLELCKFHWENNPETPPATSVYITAQLLPFYWTAGYFALHPMVQGKKKKAFIDNHGEKVKSIKWKIIWQ